MKTKSGSIDRRRLGRPAALALTLSASLLAQGTGLSFALASASSPGARAIALTLMAGSLLCLVGALLILVPMLRARAAAAPPPTDVRTCREPAARESLSREQAAALAQAQKMEALGLLAGGVAHDFNNLLHVIRNSLEILQRQDPQTDTRRYLEMIRRSADRASALTRQLLAFSRRQPVEPRPLDPNDLVAQVTELLRHSLGERITIQTFLDREVWNVAADAGQLETALLNLAINARDAMSQSGLLTIETANDASGTHPCVMIAVSDTGTGMAPEVAARACEPFFTTKEPGQGTGLGLSQVAGFAQQSGGHVRISSVPGSGTSVRLYLPKCGPVAAGPVAAGEAAAPRARADRRRRAWSVRESKAVI